MSAGKTSLRRQVADLRALVAQAAALHASAHLAQDEDSVAWAERVSGLVLDPWQRDVLLAEDARLAILCCRQSGKSTIVALKAADLVRRGGMAIVVAPSLRQSSLLFRTLNRLLIAGGESFRRETATELETVHGGLALCLPGDRPDMLRGLKSALAENLDPDRRRSRPCPRDNVGDDSADARRGPSGAAGAPEHAGRCVGRVPQGDDKPRERLAPHHRPGGGLPTYRPGLPISGAVRPCVRRSEFGRRRDHGSRPRRRGRRS